VRAPRHPSLIELGLSALADVCTANAPPLRINFYALSGEAYTLDSQAAQRLTPATTACATEVLCNGAGILALFTGTLGETPGAVFECRGAMRPVRELARLLDTPALNALSVRLR
jgi:hypothetical protein